MVRLILEEKEYYLPESWDEVTYSMYKKFSLLEIENENYIEYIMMVISMITGIDIKYLNSLEKNSFNNIISAMSFLLDFERSNSIKNKFNIGDDSYVVKDLKKLTMGEYISLEMLIKENALKNAGNIIYILFRKNDEEFDSSKMEENGKIIEDNLGVIDVLNMLDFFLFIGKTYTKIMNFYSKVRIKKERMKKKSALIRNLSWVMNGLGFHWSMGWHMVT